jgi:GNAT superfamily N-acetyltransferase
MTGHIDSIMFSFVGWVCMRDIYYRKPVSSDLAQLQLLVDDFYQAEAVPGLSKRPDVGLSFANFDESPDQGQIVVFESNATIIGYAILIFYWSNEYGGNVIVIDEMFVSESYREQGIPSHFLSWIEQSFSHKSAGMSMQVSHVNEKAAKLYGELGFWSFPCNNLLKVFGKQISQSDSVRE